MQFWNFKQKILLKLKQNISIQNKRKENNVKLPNSIRNLTNKQNKRKQCQAAKFNKECYKHDLNFSEFFQIHFHLENCFSNSPKFDKTQIVSFQNLFLKECLLFLAYQLSAENKLAKNKVLCICECVDSDLLSTISTEKSKFVRIPVWMVKTLIGKRLEDAACTLTQTSKVSRNINSVAICATSCQFCLGLNSLIFKKIVRSYSRQCW